MAVKENDLKLVYIYTATEQSSKLLEILEASFMKGWKVQKTMGYYENHTGLNAEMSP